ncbi:MAG TPA: hypothetical protein VJ829_03260 [Candidatus Binatia bacterium]|nr:hypothetical protein [Candidatus Binatia bacterium]
MAITMPAAQRVVWDRMIAEAHPWLAFIKTQAVKDSTASMRYNSAGRWSGLYYLITGEAAFAARAYAVVDAETNHFQTALKPGNATREQTIERVLLFDWLRPALTNEEATRYRDWLMLTAEGCFGYGLRFADSDQVCGTYGFFALMDTVCGTDYLSREMKDGSGGALYPMGGLDATAADRTTYRNAVRQYIEVMGAGGQWIESQEYNLGTPNLLYMLWASLRAALGTDHFPEYAAWLTLARLYHRHELIPGGLMPFQWSDVQDSHGMHWVNRDTTYAWLRAGDSDMEAFAADVDTVHARVVPSNLAPLYVRYFYYADPYAARTPWQEATPLAHLTPGTGHAYWRTGWTPTDRATHVTAPAFSHGGAVDHWPNQHGTLQHARAGRFLLDQPQGYMPSIECGNVLLVCASGPSREAGALTASAYAPDAIAYTAGTNCGMGPDIARKYYLPPPTYLHEHTRAVFELLDGPASILVIADRVHTDDPRQQTQANGTPSLLRYPKAAQTRMSAARGLVDVLWHMPVPPTLAPGVISWLVPDSPWRVEIRQILPRDPFAVSLVDEAAAVLTAEVPKERRTLDEITPLVAAEERKWRVHATAPEPTSLPTFQTIVQVIVCSEGAPAVTTAPLETDVVRGVVVTRPDSPDVAVLVSAQPGPIVTYSQADLGIVTTARRLTTSFTVPLPRAATVYLADLDPAATWAATLDGTHALIERVGDLVGVTCERGGELKLWANEEPPTPKPIVPDWRITEQSATRIVLER